MAEACVKTVKRDYVRVSQIPDAVIALALIDSWTEDYNTVHPHSRLGYRSPVACPSLTGSIPDFNRAALHPADPIPVIAIEDRLVLPGSGRPMGNAIIASDDQK